MAVPPANPYASSPHATQSRQPTSSHRLPTVSASQALQNLQESGSSFLSTGLRQPDAILSANSDDGGGGLERRKVTELWGPNGAGKTAIALQTAVNALNEGSAVFWVDALDLLSATRLQSLLVATNSSSLSCEEQMKKFHHTAVPTLSHLLALILYPREDLFPPGVSLFVLDGLDALVNLDYPRYQGAGSGKPEQQKWQAGRRYAILGSLVSALNKLAALHNTAVIVTTSCSTRMRSDSGLGAAVVPGVGGAEWDGGIWNKLAVFRDFGGRFVGVQKCQGKLLISREEVGEAGKLICFDVASDGQLRERGLDKPLDGAVATGPKQRSSPVKPAKRPFDEIADSEDEEDVDEYGWIDADEHALVGVGILDEAQAKEVEQIQNNDRDD